MSNKPSFTAAPTPAALLARLNPTNAHPDDILALARALGPVDLSENFKGKTLLRLAIEREENSFGFDQVEELASMHPGGAAAAWTLADEPPLGHWLAERIVNDRRRAPPAALCSKIIQSTRSVEAKLGDALLARSGTRDLGLSPYLAYSARRGESLASARDADGEPAILLARCPEAFEAFLAGGGDPKKILPENSDRDPEQPLWARLRSRAQRRQDTDLSAHLDAWGSSNDSARESERLRDEYFASLSSYSGDEKLKSRKDWTSLKDRNGRSAMMVLCFSKPLGIKAFWTVKKADAPAADSDLQGRTLWHAAVARGKGAIPGVVQYLVMRAIPARDAKGRGLLPSLHFMPDDGVPEVSEHEWLFSAGERSNAARALPLAADWFGCPDPADARTFARWMTDERYLSMPPKPNSYTGGSPSRSVREITQLCLSLDEGSFAQLHPDLLGALAYNLALDTVHSSLSQGDPRMMLCSRMLSEGGVLEASAERMGWLREFADPKIVSLLEASMLATRERFELGQSVPVSQPDGPTARAARI